MKSVLDVSIQEGCRHLSNEMKVPHGKNNQQVRIIFGDHKGSNKKENVNIQVREKSRSRSMDYKFGEIEVETHLVIQLPTRL